MIKSQKTGMKSTKKKKKKNEELTTDYTNIYIRTQYLKARLRTGLRWASINEPRWLPS